MVRLRWLVAVWFSCCSQPPPAELSLIASPANISAREPSTTLHLQARTARAPGNGSVTLRATAGALTVTSVTLDSSGTARVGFRCSAGEAGCNGFITIDARWVERDLQASTVVEFVDAPADAGTAVDAGADDAGTPDAGGDGGAPDSGLPDASTYDAGVDAGARDAGSADAGPPSPPTFDSRDMLLLGTLLPGTIGASVLCELTRPERAYAGFAGFAGQPAPALRVGRPMLRPSDGALYYLSNRLLRRFVQDELITQVPWMYPIDPEANDPVVPTAGCGAAPVDSFLIRPDGGIVHHCGTAWREASGALAATCAGVVAFSEEGASYCVGTRDEVMDPSGVVRPISGAVSFTNVRSKPGGGFWGVGRFFSGSWERWTISVTGVATRDGVFALPPAGTQPVNADTQGWGHIDGFGNFYRWFSDASIGTSVDLIMKFTADFSTASVIYTEQDAGVLCRFHTSNLVTGP